MKIAATDLPGVFLLQPDVRPDERGCFIKTMQASHFARHGLRTDFAESYYTVSKSNVLRGLHFQVPPADGVKLACCVSGVIHDALLDLRRSSPTFGKSILLPLSGERGDMVYLPSGIAHGYWVEEGPATVLYYQCAEYAPALDQGLAWDKAGIAWPCQAPLVSVRDAGFPSLAEFRSPFR